MLADKQIGIVALFKAQDPDLEFFRHQQVDRAVGGCGAGVVGIEIYDDVFAEAPQHPHLGLSKCSSRGCHHVVYPCGIHSNTIHLAFHDNGTLVTADGLFGLRSVPGPASRPARSRNTRATTSNLKWIWASRRWEIYFPSKWPLGKFGARRFPWGIRTMWFLPGSSLRCGRRRRRRLPGIMISNMASMLSLSG